MKTGKLIFSLVLLPVAVSAIAATPAEISAAFGKAQKKGAVAVYEERCGGNGIDSVYFPGTTAQSIAKTAAALTAYSVMEQQKPAESRTDCPPGLQPGQTRILELYPDGSVKTN